MDRDFLIDLFAPFGPVAIRRMFSGYGISADGINFALALRGGLYLRADDDSIARFVAEGSSPFAYQTSTRTITVASYWQLPERLYDDPDELADWARTALAAAQRAALSKRGKRSVAKKKSAKAKVGKSLAAKSKAAKAKSAKAKPVKAKSATSTPANGNNIASRRKAPASKSARTTASS